METLTEITFWIRKCGLQDFSTAVLQDIPPIRWGRGRSGGNRALSFPLNCEFPPLPYWLPSLCAFSITRYYKVIQNFCQPVLVLTTFLFFFSPMSHLPPISYSLWPLPCILYLHNTIIHRFYPPKYLHKHCFRFLLGHLHVSGEIANNDYANFGGGG